ncbi:hypothetical protein AMTRI_Chr01g136620 [Amborella trichopoda]|uniref:uncharacterized protein LOC105421138 n=1 Tax=Amborella trichopoda TaxID=13333 RepID=UPI0005D3AF70|nr:uncharacterized protein LOC105421138 [Amborella trichopoda]|eukprot:XP_011625761.1 uncharacterized protein LOC105421138 [Amborella trichopoda]
MAFSLPFVHQIFTISSPNSGLKRDLPIASCTPTQKQEQAIMCTPCQGRGWLVCNFCQGQKTNVTASNNRIYRRCPSCRAIGVVLCSQCKVFKCVTFPNYTDGEL